MGKQKPYNEKPGGFVAGGGGGWVDSVAPLFSIICDCTGGWLGGTQRAHRRRATCTDVAGFVLVPAGSARPPNPKLRNEKSTSCPRRAVSFSAIYQPLLYFPFPTCQQTKQIDRLDVRYNMRSLICNDVGDWYVQPLTGNFDLTFFFFFSDLGWWRKPSPYVNSTFWHLNVGLYVALSSVQKSHRFLNHESDRRKTKRTHTTCWFQAQLPRRLLIWALRLTPWDKINGNDVVMIKPPHKFQHTKECMTWKKREFWARLVLSEKSFHTPCRLQTSFHYIYNSKKNHIIIIIIIILT